MTLAKGHDVQDVDKVVMHRNHVEVLRTTHWMERELSLNRNFISESLRNINIVRFVCCIGRQK